MTRIRKNRVALWVSSNVEFDRRVVEMALPLRRKIENVLVLYRNRSL